VLLWRWPRHEHVTQVVGQQSCGGEVCSAGGLAESCDDALQLSNAVLQIGDVEVLGRHTGCQVLQLCVTDRQTDRQCSRSAM